MIKNFSISLILDNLTKIPRNLALDIVTYAFKP